MSTPLLTDSKRAPRRRRLAAAAIAIAASFGLAACTSGADSTADASTDGTTALNLSVAPVLFVAPAQYAISSGMLSDAGIEGTLVEAVSPAETWPQLLAGDLDVAVMDLQSAILARSEGAPITLHAPVIESAEIVEGETLGFGMLMVPGDSSIQTLKDLEGRSIGVNSVGNQSWLDVVTVLTRAGVDVAQVEFVEIPASRAVAAIQQGQVDSVVFGEPFGTAATAEAGLRSIARVDTGVPGAPSFAWVTTQDFAAANADVMASFSEVMLASNAALDGDRALAVTAAQEALPYDPALLEEANYPTFSTEPLTQDQLQQVVDRMVEYDVITPDAVPDLGSMLPGNAG